MKRTLRWNKLLILIIIPLLIITNITFIILYIYSQQEVASLKIANDDLNNAVNSLIYKSPEALSACMEKQEDELCSFQNTDNTILGTCKNLTGQLTCVGTVK